MFVATVTKSNPPKARKTAFGIRNTAFVEFSDGTKGMIDASAIMDFRVGALVTVEARPEKGWINVNKKTPYTVERVSKTVHIPLAEARITADQTIEFSVVVDNERFVGSVEANYPVIFNLSLGAGILVVSGTWIPKTTKHTHRETEVSEDYWLFESGTHIVPSDEIYKRAGESAEWGELHAVFESDKITSFADLMTMLDARCVNMPAMELIKRLMMRNSFTPHFVEYLWWKAKADPSKMFFNLKRREFWWSTGSGYIRIVPSVGTTVSKMRSLWTNETVVSFVATNDYDAWEESIDAIWDAV